MLVFKVNYVDNRVISVKAVNHVELTEPYIYESNEGFITHAFVKASDALAAEKIGSEIRDKFLSSLLKNTNR